MTYIPSWHRFRGGEITCLTSMDSLVRIKPAQDGLMDYQGLLNDCKSGSLAKSSKYGCGIQFKERSRGSGARALRPSSHYYLNRCDGRTTKSHTSPHLDIVGGRGDLLLAAAKSASGLWRTPRALLAARVEVARPSSQT